jgi:hypothetical protein
MAGKTAVALAAGLAASVVTGGILVLGGAYSGEAPAFNNDDVTIGREQLDAPDKEVEEPADVKVEGDEVKNLRTDANSDRDFCKKSRLRAGEGKADKGGTCLSVPIGEVAKNPVKVAVENAPVEIGAGEAFKIGVKVEDKFGPLDLDGFTFDETGKAGKAFLEGPGELGNQSGRPFLHCHLGITTLQEKGGLPGDKYDAAFSGVQGFKGDDLSVEVGGLNKGFYRGDVYCSQPGHLPLPTAKADFVQAFDSFEFEVK